MIQLASNYQRARKRFLSLAKQSAWRIESYQLEGYKGIEDENLFCDIAIFGRSTNEKCLIISSALHGIEGYCGSAIQCELLDSHAFDKLAEDITVILVHALNPYGFSHLLRVNENNIDLNRNFCDFSNPLSFDPAMQYFNEQVLPAKWQDSDLLEVRDNVNRYVEERGLEEFQRALSVGQYSYPNNPFYGGRCPQWTHKLWVSLCQKFVKGFQRIVHIDLHTGLGLAGDCEVMYLGAYDSQKISLAKRWYGEDKVKIPGAIGSTSKPITGVLATHLSDIDVEDMAIVLEFGTQEFKKVGFALIDDCWLFNNPNCDAGLRLEIQQKMRSAFMSEDRHWADKIWQHSRYYVQATLEGMSEAKT